MNAPPLRPTNDVSSGIPVEQKAREGPTHGDRKLIIPPTQYELPSDDGENLDTERHGLQIELLRSTLRPWLGNRPDGFIGGNMFVYFRIAQVTNTEFKGPDFFVVLGVPKGERRSWVCWEEEKAPDLVIELLSHSTAHSDKNEKKRVYEKYLRVTEYYWYDPFNPADWAGFQLQNGEYKEFFPNAQGQFVSQTLQLALVRWTGTYQDVEATWLRWAELDGTLLPTPSERAQEEQRRAEEEQRRAEEERRRAQEERRRADEQQRRAELAELQTVTLVKNLLRAGMTEAQIAAAMGLTLDQIHPLLASAELKEKID